jgi:FKBP-type peptidyl-prolyl cis-trans isomerase FkpA
VRRGVRWAWVVGMSLACAAGGACAKAPTSPSNSAPFSETDLVVGTGATAATGMTLTVNYTGWLYDASMPDDKGAVFNSTVGQTPFSFTLGSSTVIAGWNQGLAGMQVGGVRRLVIPPSLAYGGSRSGIIPPYATLVFEVELLAAD